MCFNRRILLCAATAWLGLMLHNTAQAADRASAPARLKLTPDTCVALQQGRLCYATIQVQWDSLTAEELCLFAGPEKLQCWPAGHSGQWRYDFVATDSQQLQLRSADKVLAEAVVKVNWVQKSTKIKRHWRLF